MAKLISADLTNNKLCIFEYTTIGGRMLSFKKDAFDAKIISHTYTNVGSIIFEKPITKIGNHGFDSYFEECNNLKSITIPDSVTTIGDYAFSSCDSLTSVTIGNGVTFIDNYAFFHCRSLTSIVIPNSVTSIGGGTFYECTSMQYYDFSTHESVPTLANTSAFSKIPSTCKIIVPDALYDEWIAATNWSTYASYTIKKSDWDASQTTE